MNEASQLNETASYCPVIIVGGGQAGLSMSYYLKKRNIEHLVFEKRRIAEAWRSERWDSFCLVTPNWQCRLPGFPYTGPDPEGFMGKEEIVAYLESYVNFFQPPVREGLAVLRLSQHETDSFLLQTSAGDYIASQVVIATGGYQVAIAPRLAERFPEDIHQLHSSEYRKAADLPAGDVLVVGSGQSGCQIAEDLHLAGRRVHLCVGGAPRTARRYRGRDVVAWLDAMGYYSKPVHEHPLKERVRNKANHYVTGRGGGRDIDLRKFALEGMQLYGRLIDVREGQLTLGLDLKQNLDQADAVAESIKDTIDKFISANQIEAPVETRYRPVWEPGEPVLALNYRDTGIRSVIWCLGFGTDYRWVELPIFDGKGYPTHRRGVTSIPGIYCLGLPWQYTWGSGRFSGVARDAEFLAECIEMRLDGSAGASLRSWNELALGS
jgi:putative flavoprotein involved in K+ transport